MLSIVCVRLPCPTPMAGLELTPEIVLRRADGNTTSEDFPESNLLDGCFIAYKWSRVYSGKTDPVCSVHPFMQSTVQCIECSNNPKIADVCSFHCNTDCYQDAWEYHLSLHDKAASSVKEDDIFAKITASSASPSTSTGGQSSRTVREGGGVELTLEVGRSKTYVPTDHDVGHGLKFECVVVDASTRTPASEATTVWTSTVRPAPCPRQRLMFLLHEATWPSSSGGPSAPKGTFTVLSYNILSDGRAKGGRYNYCPPSALSWSYRRQNLLREITGYRADVICLQQVQSNHFENFFAPELQKHGYKALYMANRTEEVRDAFAAETGDSCPVEGCATFFYKKRISLVKSYEVELHNAAQSFADILVSDDQKESLLSLLPKGNAAVFVVLNTNFSGPLMDVPGQEQVFCVANAYSTTDYELKIVQLFETYTIVQELEKLATTENIPSLLCGGFNFIPGSAPHEYLTRNTDPVRRHFSEDPFIPPHIAKRGLTHQLPLVSAYSSFATMEGGGPYFEEQRRRMNLRRNEPRFTNRRANFSGTLDFLHSGLNESRVVIGTYRRKRIRRGHTLAILLVVFRSHSSLSWIPLYVKSASLREGTSA